MQYQSHDGTFIEKERWAWVVTYRDGSIHKQFDDSSGKYNHFGSIDIDKVSAITMVCDDSNKSYSIKLPNGSKLIHHYSNIIKQPIGGETVRYRLYCFGYETEDDKKLFTILPTDIVVHGEVENIDVL